MKEKFYAPLVFILCFGFLFSSCQKDGTEYNDETDDGQAITADLVLTKMLISASQNNGSADDIIDGSSCMSIVFPFDVVVNNQGLTMESLADVDLVQVIFDEFPDDTDIVDIVFPISVVYEDYSQIEISNQAELVSIITNCPNFIDDTYSCMEFIYPISCFVYNSLNEQTGFITLNNDLDWFAYLNYLEEDIVVAIDYQMTILFNGEVVQVFNNQQLMDAFTLVDCEAGNGSGGVDPEIEAFRNVMKDGIWNISQFLNNGVDETLGFIGYDFTFLESITVYASNGMVNINGIWFLTSEGGELNFNFNMESPINGANDEDYKVLQFSDTEITVVTRDSSGNIEDTLVFVKQ